MSARTIALLGAALLFTAAQAAGPAFVDPLDAPARLSPRATLAPVFALARLDGEHAIGVGPRGHILRTADRGQSWTQQAVPLSTDLVAVHFPTARVGWAVGHDGVVLRSQDGGTSWARMIDGRALGALMVSFYERLVAAGDTSVARALEDARRFQAEGPTKPFLAVHFRNEREGWVIGQFNLILYTADGGASWEPWIDRTDNPDGYSLHTIGAAGDQIVIVGELGLVLRLDAAARRFVRVTTPYPGTWFGFAATKDTWIALGLRGSAWRSTDVGASWTKLNTGTTAAVNNGLFLADGRLVLVTQAGELLISVDRGDHFSKLPRVPALRSGFDLLALEPGWLLVASPGGVQRIAVPPSTTH
ncbi:MAG: YCF48-related protein [Burkholderiaceae bacterium]